MLESAMQEYGDIIDTQNNAFAIALAAKFIIMFATLMIALVEYHKKVENVQ